MNRTLRVPILILLPLLLIAGLVVESRTDETPEVAVRVGELTATAAAPGTPSSTWYCAAGSATGVASGEGAGAAEQRVIVANSSDEPATGSLTVYPQGAPPTTVPVDVAPRSRTEVKVSDVVVAPWASVLVETTGGQVTVAHQLTGPDAQPGRSVSDCASTPSANWYFPGGTTARGSVMWIALFNPFPGEATVDLTFETEKGARTPEDYQGIVVPGGSVVVEQVSDRVTVAEHAAATVSTRSGRVVAEVVQSFNGVDGGPKGLTALMGATTPAPIWTFPAGAPDGVDASESVTIFNPGGSDTDVIVQVQLDDPVRTGTVEPFEVTVPAHRYTSIDVSGDERVPAGDSHWLIVRSVDGAEIVAQRNLAVNDSKGVSFTMGLPVVGTQWLATVGSVADVSSSLLAVANPSEDEVAHVNLRRQGNGQVVDVDGAIDLQIAPGERVVIDLGQANVGADGSVLLDADIPVVVAQWMSFSTPSDVATPLGIPVSGTQSLLRVVIGPTVATDEPATDGGSGEAPPLADPATTVPGADGTEGAPDAGETTTTTAGSSGSSTTTAAG